MRASRCIRVVGLPPDEAETIMLLAPILGWSVEDGAAGEAKGPEPADWDADGADVDDALRPVAAGAVVAWVNGGSARPDQQDWPGAAAAAMIVPPQMILRLSGNVIAVQAADDALAVTLARLGLDRLVLPLSLAALEELLAIAG